MTTIILPDDLERILVENARMSGTTPESLAIDGLRRLFAGPGEGGPHESLLDFLGDYVGAVEGSTEPLSEGCGRRFAEGLAEGDRGGRP